MATTTTYLTLRKPDTSDQVSVTTDISNNADLIDAYFEPVAGSTQAIGDSASAGSAGTVSRSDHKHALPGFGAVSSVGAANANGTATTVPHSDHVHGLGAAAFGTPVSIGTAAADGAATTAARSDHVHGLSNGQLAFPASQNASADANTLDDYEEGTWTPSLGGSATYNGSRAGTYTKIGRMVFVRGRMSVNAIGTGSTTTISGLPFTANNTTTYTSGRVAYFANLAINSLALYAYAVSATVTFSHITAAGVNVTDTPAIFGNSADVIFSVVYEV